jgi:AbrB family looped-hinge helix DNA binding protein
MHTSVNQQGRIVIPSEFRKALGIHAGDPVVVTLEGDSVRVRKAAAAVEAAQQLVTNFAGERNLVDELLDERRQED